MVGASGAVMGFVGLTVADIAINSGDLLHILLRLSIILAAVVFFIVTAVTKVSAALKTLTSYHATIHTKNLPVAMARLNYNRCTACCEDHPFWVSPDACQLWSVYVRSLASELASATKQFAEHLRLGVLSESCLSRRQELLQSRNFR